MNKRRPTLEVGVLLTFVLGVALAVVSCGSKTVEAAPPIDTSVQRWPSNPNDYHLREVQLMDGTKCALASQGGSRGGVSITCNWKTP